VQIDSGDTAWVLASAALVMLMTPALGFFYGGLVRQKNVLSTIMHSFFILCLISVQWVLWGYSLAFGPDKGHLIGGLEWIGLNNVGLTPNPDYAPTIPHQAFMVFQMMFAVITPALITGAFAERKRFKAFVLFSLLWATFIYDPIAHWVWGAGGWLHTLGALDFAGGTVVHISSGVSALVAALVLGRRLGFGREKVAPHDSTMTVLGAALLWFGWFGFNAGSALTAGGLATNAFVVTNTAAAMAALTWMTVSWWHKRQPSVLGSAAGAVAGLVAITPASGFVNAMGAIVIGFGAGVVCYAAIQLRERIRVDDALDVWAVHGIGGTWGAIATGLFATVAVNSTAANGLFYGNPRQVLVQLLAVGAVWLYSAAGTYVILKLVNLVVPLRVQEDEEVLGLDLSQHGEPAYANVHAL
jgi:ammonium transporter, Amt family